MFKEERHAAILQYIEENGKINTATIQRHFSVGFGTAMNDLNELAEKGLVQRTHGGAIKLKQVGYAPDGIRTLSSKERCAEITDNYLAIARKAIEMIEKNDVIYLTSASLGYIIAKELPADLFVTVVVNSISIAEELRSKQCRVIVTGGEMHENGNFYDDFTSAMLRRIKFDKSFLTSAACTPSFGLSVQTARNIGLMNIVIENSRQVIGMYPAEKLGRDSILQICPASAMDILITEAETDDDVCSSFTELGVDVIKV